MDSPAVVLLSEVYGTLKEGISTIYRRLAQVLREHEPGIPVYSAVLKATEEDKEDAKSDGVGELLLPKVEPGDQRTTPTLDWLTFDHRVKYPHLPKKVKTIVGHTDGTSRAACGIKQDRCPEATAILFIDDIPEETDQYKGDEEAMGIGKKEDCILEDAQQADVVFSIGDRIFDHFENQFRAIPANKRPQHIKLVPRPSRIFEDADAEYKDTGTMVVLFISRVTGVAKLNGLDLAVDALSIVAEKMPVKIRVRGVNKEDTQARKATLERCKSANLQITFIPYGTQKDICRDMLQAHLVLVPSRAEPFGFVGLEAIAAGVPVLVSDKSGLADLIRKYATRYHNCIVETDFGGDEKRNADHWARRIERVLKYCKAEFETAAALKKTLLSSRYWEESERQFIDVCASNKAGWRGPGDQQRTRWPSEQHRKRQLRRSSGSGGHVGKKPKANVSVLLVSDEYCTSKGGISSINLNVARKLTTAGAKIYATVLKASDQDERDAERDGVILLKPQVRAGYNAKPTLEWLTEYHAIHFPHIPPNISCIVGHADVTSTAARKIKEDRFQYATLAMFGHVMPEETDPYKSDEKALWVGRKEASIQDDLGKADVVFSVGARIHRHNDRFLRQRHVDHHIFLPEPSKVFSDANVCFGEEGDIQKPERVILSIGRVLNVERLKGHDLAVGAVDKVAERLHNQFTLRLRVRGIDENDFKVSKRILDDQLRSGRVKPTLLPYGTQEEIRRDMENCHLVLMPSRAEPFGLVGLEAIAAGVPVLISEQSGLAELVEQLAKQYQPSFRHRIVKMKGDTATNVDAEKWADCIEDVIKNAKTEFEEAHTFRDKLLASKYWEESHQKFLQACGIISEKP